MNAPGPVLVTGGTSGIGFGIARALVASGRSVSILSRDPQRCRDAAAGLGEASVAADVLALPCDVRDEAAVNDAVGDTLARWGRLDGVVTAAGTLARGSVLDLDPDTFEAAWRTNVLGTWNAIRSCLPAMLDNGFGRIVTVGSVLGDVGAPRRAGYAATKGAVAALTRSAALELAGTGVTVNCVAPGPVRTALVAAVPEGDTGAYDDAIPMDTWGRPADVAHLVLPLLAAEAGWTTGTIVHVDGGYTAR